MADRILLEPKPELEKWRLVERVRFPEYGVTVRKGFLFDGGSIPAAARPIVGCNLDPVMVRGYLLHDYLYWLARQGKRKYDRKQADGIMRDLHLADGASETIANLVYLGVRRGASYHWMTEAEKSARNRFEWDDELLDQ